MLLAFGMSRVFDVNDILRHGDLTTDRKARR
jgi:hypothetical protein